MGYPVLGHEDELPVLVSRLDIAGLLVAIGDNSTRQKVVERACASCPGIPFVRAIHPSATLARSAQLGEGSVIMAGAVVNPCSSIGAHCIVNTRASLDHDCVMGDYASLAPCVCVGGNSKIGAFSAVGIGATIIHGVKIGAHSVIGAGATVLKDVPDYTVAYGTPARPVRLRKEGERYL